MAGLGSEAGASALGSPAQNAGWWWETKWAVVAGLGFPRCGLGMCPSLGPPSEMGIQAPQSLWEPEDLREHGQGKAAGSCPCGGASVPPATVGCQPVRELVTG